MEQKYMTTGIAAKVVSIAIIIQLVVIQTLINIPYIYLHWMLMINI